ncbi:ribosome maturation factor RimM [Propioniciclava coleopterorum]|uniref:Ribosome maturation factor RimM n=1 Tax=Propioniciclava coleopterorum TaxID=2714937 RepID=A0A6G7Y8J7_9ACTN|nr:ribosome maturation factor RimM [Propioniciclava coleopterorum]QIK73142.1 ribosome maturation factor RimM [Propioniciclava coleopterorum]
MTQTEDVLIGTIGRAHGLRGEVSVRVRTDEPELRFVAGEPVLIGGAPRVLDAVRWHSGTLLIRLAGVSDRTAAEALAGTDLWARVPADALPTEDDAYYDRQLIGLRVLDAAGAEVGAVADVLHLPSQDVLAVRTPAGERLVPFVTELVPVVDLERGLVQVAEVPGLLTDLEEA